MQALGLVEHEVLEQVREAGLARLLVARADAEPREVAEDGRALVDQDEQAQAVAEPEALENVRRVDAEPAGVAERDRSFERPFRGERRGALVDARDERGELRVGHG